MSGFDQLHPDLQHHIANSLGWQSLRPFQEEVIPEILSQKHLVVLAPTAGGKTEAAVFPLLSRMLSEQWTGLSVLYLCPLKALLNDLDLRLTRYCSLVGRRSGLWHGDVTQTERKRIASEPPDVLLTTPESLEVILMSRRLDPATLFGQLRAVVVDEVHAFAGDDRGWHLQAVVERASAKSEHAVQRIGLSATVGNPAELTQWLAGSQPGERGHYVRPSDHLAEADVQVDYVGTLDNAALVISKLHRGEKRLVFIDSRAGAEKLSAELNKLAVPAFVTHGSLSKQHRRAAEEAFRSRSDCVIVATSVLELGIDVGDLDRVIQVGAPVTVSSFLQRMGRTGRRDPSKRNCLFLAVRHDSLLVAAALVEMWKTGFVEPTQPPPSPFHVLAQQLMAITLQEGGTSADRWYDEVKRVPAFAEMAPEEVQELFAFMLAETVLAQEQGVLRLGTLGEQKYGRKNYLKLFSVFMTEPLFRVVHGREEIGQIDELTLTIRKQGRRLFLLGGRTWEIEEVDWQKRLVRVREVRTDASVMFSSVPPGLGYPLCQAMRGVLASKYDRPWWSRRATEKIAEKRGESPWLEVDKTTLLRSGEGGLEWWTFGGVGVNATLANSLAAVLRQSIKHSPFSLEFPRGVRSGVILQAIAQLAAGGPAMPPEVDERMLYAVKFSECVPHSLALRMLERRVADPENLKRLLEQPIAERTVEPRDKAHSQSENR
ncbi:ATP-dependent RNA helicase RhlE [Pirellulimonas nuda]|uniref:ATP-dependent RNA helicase RhlE n=1 Tax=Pirellulimonas nuda TaxID=2528009 RepID=A0A518DHG1_9BACT|nr:DEAD/DEAH box helicase [Pirellulimonas nuda]QDU90913.1 ATP-dependent RNA helicase RhlE [Pirellulimonas nuda]